MVERRPDNCKRCAFAVFAAVLAGGGLFSATTQGAEIMLAAYDKFVWPFVDIYPVAGMVGGALLVAWCGERMATKRGLHRNMLALFLIIAASVGASAIVHPGGISGGHRLSAWHVMTPMSALAVCSGIAFSAYYGAHGTPHKILDNKIVMILLIAASAVVYAYAQDAIDGQPAWYQVAWHMFAVGAVVSTVMLVAVIGAGHTACKRPNRGQRLPEYVWWSLLFGPPLLIATLSVAYGLSTQNDALLQYALYGVSAVTVLAGAGLSSHLNSLMPRLVAKFWFGYIVVTLVYVLSAVSVEAHRLSVGQSSDAELPFTLALIPPTMGLLGALLGAHISARLKMRARAG